MQIGSTFSKMHGDDDQGRAGRGRVGRSGAGTPGTRLASPTCFHPFCFVSVATKRRSDEGQGGARGVGEGKASLQAVGCRLQPKAVRQP